MARRKRQLAAEFVVVLVKCATGGDEAQGHGVMGNEQK
jgi:hypothetical protein